MSKKRSMLAIFFALVGCASRQGLNDLLTDITPPPKHTSVEETKLVYDGRLRGYTYDGKMLFNEVGEKIRSKEEAMERLSVEIAKKRPSSFEKMSPEEGASFGLTAVYVVPVGFALGW